MAGCFILLVLSLFEVLSANTAPKSNLASQNTKPSSIRSGILCADCGPYCVATTLARPMRGECKGQSSSTFYDTQEGEPYWLWKEESLIVRYCVQNQAFANLRAQSAQSSLSQLDPTFQGYTVSDAQGQCRLVWINSANPPTFFYTCNDPTGMEEAQISGFTSPADFEPYKADFSKAVASAVNSLSFSNTTILTPQDVHVWSVFVGQVCEQGFSGPCTCSVQGSTAICPSKCCTKLLSGPNPGIRVQFNLSYSRIYQNELDKIFYSSDTLALEIGKVFGQLIGTSDEVQLSKGRDGSTCGGPQDTTTCLAGAVCGPITDRSKFTSFVSSDWWVRSDQQWYGGLVPAREVLRAWYCSRDPRLYIGQVRIGQVGSQSLFLNNSNLKAKSECDAVHGDQQCSTVNSANPVPADCCGYCFLSNIHLMKLFQCKGMQNILHNPEAVSVLAQYCLKQQRCREERPCSGNPVKMGDPFQLLNAARLNIYCDPLDRGCMTPYIDGSPVTPNMSICGFRRACDLRLESLRLRVGYYGNDTSVFAQAQEAQSATSGSTNMIVGVTVAVVVVLAGLAAGVWWMWRKRERKKIRKALKSRDKYLKKKLIRIGNEPQEEEEEEEEV